VNLDPVIGTEIRKTRPAVVVSNDSCNRYGTRVVVLPITSNVDSLYPGEAEGEVKGKRGRALGDQIRSIDKGRLKSRAGRLTSEEMSRVDEALAITLDRAGDREPQAPDARRHGDWHRQDLDACERGVSAPRVRRRQADPLPRRPPRPRRAAVRAFAAFEAEPSKKFDKLYEVYSQRFQRDDVEGEAFDPKVLPKSYLETPHAGQAYVYVCRLAGRPPAVDFRHNYM
jgi:mRNA interferase MazF